MPSPLRADDAPRGAGGGSAHPDGAARRGFPPPTALEALHGLARVLGPACALELWSGASQATGVHGTDLHHDDHVRLVEHLAASTEGPARAAAVSHLTRLRAHRVLSRAEG